MDGSQLKCAVLMERKLDVHYSVEVFQQILTNNLPFLSFPITVHAHWCQLWRQPYSILAFQSDLTIKYLYNMCTEYF